jgi:hypothetical protein
MLDTLKCLMLKSTSLCCGSLVQVEVCARAKGAISARMPITSAKRFIVKSFRVMSRQYRRQGKHSPVRAKRRGNPDYSARHLSAK